MFKILAVCWEENNGVDCEKNAIELRKSGNVPEVNWSTFDCVQTRGQKRRTTASTKGGRRNTTNDEMEGVLLSMFGQKGRGEEQWL